MAQRVGGKRRKTRHLTRKPVERRGKISIRKMLQDLNPGDKVLLKMESAVQKGLYFRRFHGKTGTVQGKRGHAYLVKITDGRKEKLLVVGAVHLKKLRG
ncbi:50S ribosomal protein L21e [Candidatus Woesearchaeota archaeon]|nr:50S ribosomal protein L21e [Candidatus Woesearchaeota archaeon]